MILTPSLLLSAAGVAVACTLALWVLWPRNTRGKPEIPEIRAHFNQMVAEYETLPSNGIDRKSRSEIDSLLHKAPDDLTWDDVYRFELLMLHLMPLPKLRRRAWLIRSRYAAITGNEIFQRYLKSLPAADQPPHAERTPDILARLGTPYHVSENEEDLRADLETVLEDTHWLYRLRSSWETQRNWLSRSFLQLYAAFMLLMIVAVLTMDHKDRGFHPLITLLAVPFAGALGGFLSLMHRVNKVQNDPNQPVPLLEMEYGRGALLGQALITGAISGTALFLLFASRLLTGEFFPDYESIMPAREKKSILNLLNALPDNAQAFSMTLVWAFIAGFAERLVPDFLDQFTRITRHDESGTGKPRRIRSPARSGRKGNRAA